MSVFGDNVRAFLSKVQSSNDDGLEYDFQALVTASGASTVTLPPVDTPPVPPVDTPPVPPVDTPPVPPVVDTTFGDKFRAFLTALAAKADVDGVDVEAMFRDLETPSKGNVSSSSPSPFTPSGFATSARMGMSL